MSIVFKRYGPLVGYYPVRWAEGAEGDWVKAQDAYDKCAVLSAEIATLKAQLKGYQEREKLFRTAQFGLAYGAGPKTIEKLLRST